MDERLIQQQEQELAKTGRYYLHVCFMTIPLLCMACFLYGLRPLLLCGAALLTGNLCDRLVSLLRRRVYRAGDFSNESFALIIALLNMTIKPILQVIGLPITIISLGVFYLVINTLLLYLAAALGGALFGIGFVIDSFGSGFVAAIVISLVSALMNAVLGVND